MWQSMRRLGFLERQSRHPGLFGPRTPVIPGTVRYRAPGSEDRGQMTEDSHIAAQSAGN
jgi:hypothetical protein